MITNRMNELMRKGVKYELLLLEEKIQKGYSLIEKENSVRSYQTEEEFQAHMTRVKKYWCVLDKLKSEVKQLEEQLLNIELELYEELA